MISDAMNINGHRYVLREDYDALAARCAEQDALIESLQNRWASRPLSAGDTTELEARCEALEKDAARYRELIATDLADSDLVAVTCGDYAPHWVDDVEAQLDAAIAKRSSVADGEKQE